MATSRAALAAALIAGAAQAADAVPTAAPAVRPSDGRAAATESVKQRLVETTAERDALRASLDVDRGRLWALGAWACLATGAAIWLGARALRGPRAAAQEGTSILAEILAEGPPPNRGTALITIRDGQTQAVVSQSSTRLFRTSDRVTATKRKRTPDPAVAAASGGTGEAKPAEPPATVVPTATPTAADGTKRGPAAPTLGGAPVVDIFTDDGGPASKRHFARPGAHPAAGEPA